MDLFELARIDISTSLHDRLCDDFGYPNQFGFLVRNRFPQLGKSGMRSDKKERILNGGLVHETRKLNRTRRFKEICELRVALLPINAAAPTQRKVPTMVKTGDTFKMDAPRIAHPTPAVALRVAMAFCR
jgi:hypothetical protein